MENLLIGLSTQNRTGKYLYYGGYDTDDIGSLVTGELAMFFAKKSAGPDSDTGAFTLGGANDDSVALGGSNIDIADTPAIVTNSDLFYFAQGIGSSTAKIGLILSAKDLSFKTLEYKAPIKKVQTITIAAASLVAGKTIKFDMIYKTGNPIFTSGKLMKQVDYTITTATAEAIAHALDALLISTTFYDDNIYSVSNTHSGDVVITVTWKAGSNGTIVANTTSTATPVVATTTAYVTGNGMGADIVALEKEVAVREGYNPAIEASGLYNRPFSAAAATNYHVIVITSRNHQQDILGLRNEPVMVTQYIAIDTADSDGNLFEEIVSILTDIVEKRAIASGL